MAKSIKTREVVKNIKVHDSAANVGGRIKDIGVKTKDSVMDQINNTNDGSPEQYATDKVIDAMRNQAENVTQKAGVRAEKVAKETVYQATKKVKNKIEAKKEEKLEAELNKDLPEDDVTSKKKADIKQSTKAEIKEKPQVAPKETNNSTPIEDKRKPRQRQQTPPKQKEKGAVKKANENKGVRKPDKSNGKIKQTKRSTENTGKTIKTTKNSVKSPGRTAKTAKTAKTTAKATAETARKTKEVAQKTAKATVKTVKAVAKAIVEVGKAVIAGVKSIWAVIAAGGVPAIVVIVVICLIGAIGGTCFGIFLANDETTGTNKTMTQAVSELTSEHYSNLVALRTSFTYDLYEVQGNTSINWKDILAVYAVKTTSSDNPLEVVTLDDEKIELLRTIMKDMNKMTGAIVPKIVAETTVVTDENGIEKEVTSYITKRVLVVTIVQLNANQIAEIYRMNDIAKEQIKELLREEYDDLWDELIGSSGMIITSNTSYVGTGIFAWPLDGDYNITSRFGTRTDPISGVVKTHGGTDIAAPLGTPLLAAAGGTVITASYDADGYGYYVKIRHDDTFTTLYGHCSVLHVTVGQTVKQGQLIAEVGSTGYSTGPHLHYEVIQNGVRVDAMRFYTN